MVRELFRAQRDSRRLDQEQSAELFATAGFARFDYDAPGLAALPQLDHARFLPKRRAADSIPVACKRRELPRVPTHRACHGWMSLHRQVAPYSDVTCRLAGTAICRLQPVGSWEFVRSPCGEPPLLRAATRTTSVDPFDLDRPSYAR